MIFLWSHIIPDHDQILLHTSGLPVRVHVFAAFSEAGQFIVMNEHSGLCFQLPIKNQQSN